MGNTQSKFNTYIQGQSQVAECYICMSEVIEMNLEVICVLGHKCCYACKKELFKKLSHKCPFCRQQNRELVSKDEFEFEHEELLSDDIEFRINCLRTLLETKQAMTDLIAENPSFKLLKREQKLLRYLDELLEIRHIKEKIPNYLHGKGWREQITEIIDDIGDFSFVNSKPIANWTNKELNNVKDYLLDNIDELLVEVDEICSPFYC